MGIWVGRAVGTTIGERGRLREHGGNIYRTGRNRRRKREGDPGEIRGEKE